MSTANRILDEQCFTLNKEYKNFQYERNETYKDNQSTSRVILYDTSLVGGKRNRK